jgi:hypothetical protein
VKEFVDTIKMQFWGNDGGGDVFVYTGGEQQVPRDVKRVRIAESVDIILARTFQWCTFLTEVEGHNKLKKVEGYAFHHCFSLRRVRNMQGLIEIEQCAFCDCHNLSDIDFDKLEIIGEGAFAHCRSLWSISMPSIRRIEGGAFQRCVALTDAMFGKDLERIEKYAFWHCTALRRIVIPLKDNLFPNNNAFNNNTSNDCSNLSRVDALDGEIHTTISSLHLESWREEMLEEIDRINQTLPNIRFGKSEAIQQWLARVFIRLEHYKTEHKTLLKEVMTLLELALWKANLRENEADASSAAQGGVRVTRGQRKRKRNDRCITSGASIVIKNVLPFLALK